MRKAYVCYLECEPPPRARSPSQRIPVLNPQILMRLRNPVLVALAFGFRAAMALDARCAPGGSFDLAHWSLQLPHGDDGNIRTIKSQDLQGCAGFTGPTFYTNRTTGQMVLTAPGNPSLTGCTTTSGSVHCRTELREVDKANGRNIAWSPSGKTSCLSPSTRSEPGWTRTAGTRRRATPRWGTITRPSRKRARRCIQRLSACYVDRARERRGVK